MDTAFHPGLERRGERGFGQLAIGLCIIHFIEGILYFDVYTWKEGGVL